MHVCFGFDGWCSGAVGGGAVLVHWYSGGWWCSASCAERRFFAEMVLALQSIHNVHCVIYTEFVAVVLRSWVLQDSDVSEMAENDILSFLSGVDLDHELSTAVETGKVLEGILVPTNAHSIDSCSCHLLILSGSPIAPSH